MAQSHYAKRVKAALNASALEQVMDYVKCPFERQRMLAAGIGCNTDPATELTHQEQSKIRQKARDAKRYADWEARGKPPSPSTPPKRKGKMRPSVDGLMASLLRIQGGNCYLCGGYIHSIPNTTTSASYDHVMPVSRGVVNRNNRLAAHRQCNSDKSDRLPYPCEIIYLEAVTLSLTGSR